MPTRRTVRFPRFDASLLALPRLWLWLRLRLQLPLGLRLRVRLRLGLQVGLIACNLKLNLAGLRRLLEELARPEVGAQGARRLLARKLRVLVGALRVRRHVQRGWHRADCHDVCGVQHSGPGPLCEGTRHVL